MVVEIIVDIICARDADINSIINGDITEELYAWDLDYSKTDGQYYFKAKSVNINEVFKGVKFRLNWILEGEIVPQEKLVYINNGILMILEMLESSYNAEYHLIQNELIKPKFAFEVKKIIIDGISQELNVFEEFNNKNRQFLEYINSSF